MELCAAQVDADFIENLSAVSKYPLAFKHVEFLYFNQTILSQTQLLNVAISKEANIHVTQKMIFDQLYFKVNFI